jgi:hypothetical protein
VSLARLLVLGLLAASLGAGCAYTRTARGPAGAELWIEDEVFELGEEPVEVRVPITYTDPEVRLYVNEDDVPAREGTLARTQVEPLTSAALLGCTACTTPVCMGAGFCLANPGALVLLLAPFADLFLTLGFNALASSITRPSWPTIPVVMGCAALGLVPLAGLPFALRVPDEIELDDEPRPSAARSPLADEVPF